MRTVTNGIKGHLASNTHTRCTMLRLDLADGSVLAITDHDKDIAFDLGDGSATYKAGTGILAGALSLSTGFDADDIEITGPVGADVTRVAVLGGRYDDAEARLFQVNWADISQGAVKLLQGRVSIAKVEGGQFRFTISGDVARFQQTIGRLVTGYCDADFGDARCGYTPATLAATVTAVTDERAITVSFAGTYAADYFNRGTVTFTAGALTGTRPVEVQDFVGGTGSSAVTLWAPLVEEPAIGDTLTLTQGCGLTRAACLAYDNVINFRGFPDVPGSDQVLRYPNSGG